MLVRQICAYFGIFWDEADELERLAGISHPRIVVDTAGLSPKATLLANELARNIRRLDDGMLDRLLQLLDGEASTNRQICEKTAALPPP